MIKNEYKKKPSKKLGKVYSKKSLIFPNKLEKNFNILWLLNFTSIINKQIKKNWDNKIITLGVVGLWNCKKITPKYKIEKIVVNIRFSFFLVFLNS